MKSKVKPYFGRGKTPVIKNCKECGLPANPGRDFHAVCLREHLKKNNGYINDAVYKFNGSIKEE
jgi:hypothetical protein